MVNELYKPQAGSPKLSLASDIIDSDTVIALNEDVTQLPEPPNIVTITDSDGDFETVLYTGIDENNNELTDVTRGFEGTAKSWTAGDNVARLITAYDFSAVQNLIGYLEDLVAENFELATTTKTAVSTFTTYGVEETESDVYSFTTYGVEETESDIYSFTTYGVEETESDIYSFTTSTA